MSDLLRLRFFIRYTTHAGQSLWVAGNLSELGSNDLQKAIPLSYLNSEFWHGTIQLTNTDRPLSIKYYYFLKKENGEVITEWGNDRVIEIADKKIRELQIVDTWNHAGEYENAFFTAPFQNILLQKNISKTKFIEAKKYSHVFKVKAPLIEKNEALCLVGGCETLGEWSTKKPVLLNKENNWWVVNLNLKENGLPVPYKYGVYNTKKEKFIRFENGNNRVLYSDAGKRKLTVIHDGFAHLPNNTWKGAGLAIPVFSLRSKNSFGTGEFSDLKLLVDWAKAAGLRMIQLLPVNDTTTSGTWKDSYPYAAISAFALHPLYINLSKVAGKNFAGKLKPLKKKQQQLNALTALDYEAVFKIKVAVLKELYLVLKEECFSSKEYSKFFIANQYWLKPYAAYCFFRDKTGTTDFSAWDKHAIYNEAEVRELSEADAVADHEIQFWYFVQYYLHIQLKEAVEYAHENGIIVKGDIPIGVSGLGCDIWVSPELFNKQWQSGAPPDVFTVHGQNWGFPNYNWKKMEGNDFGWWKQRLNQMSHYFDAFRIDHILGFFRMWSIPLHAVQGLMGRFIPAVPVHLSEFAENGIWFDYNRFCKPYINDQVLTEVFGELSGQVKEKFVEKNEVGGYDILPGFQTQRQVSSHFHTLTGAEENERIKKGLFELIANIILFEDECPGEETFHFRISMEDTWSFRNLNPYVREKLKTLYTNYFFHRQEELWKREAMHKLWPLKSSTDMLVCGEDLGMIPHCVKEVMSNLGILSLEIQRMPKSRQVEFFHPADAPYFSVVTPSTHDTSTLREWWLENAEVTQRFYNKMLGQRGEAPPHCEPWVSKAILLQHLYSPAMWCVFQLQDILGMNEKLRRANPAEERINNPANPEHNWNYRMHLHLEELLKAKSFNAEIRNCISKSGRL